MGRKGGRCAGGDSMRIKGTGRICYDCREYKLSPYPGALTVFKNNLRERKMVKIMFKHKARSSGRSQQQKPG